MNMDGAPPDTGEESSTGSENTDLVPATRKKHSCFGRSEAAVFCMALSAISFQAMNGSVKSQY